MTTGERIIGYCRICETRKCWQSRKVQNCAYCEEYPCEKLEEFFKTVPNARKNLESQERLTLTLEAAFPQVFFKTLNHPRRTGGPGKPLGEEAKPFRNPFHEENDRFQRDL